jgi:hypothetical protein
MPLLEVVVDELRWRVSLERDDEKYESHSQKQCRLDH